MMINFQFKVSIVILSFALANCFDDYKSHDCMRDCNRRTTTPMVCKYEWTIEDYAILSTACLNCPFNRSDCDSVHCVAANGISKTILTVNRMLPGPQIQVCKNDVINVHVKNLMHSSQATTIHWHGILQKGTPYMDGVSMVTQCPINAHTSFEYKFVASESGTHFWHAHSGIQRVDGLFGALIVHDYEDENVHTSLYDYDLKEHVIVLSDWYNLTGMDKFSGFLYTDVDNKANDILINGKSSSIPLVDPTNSSNVASMPKATFQVEKDKRYRFRLINAGNLICPIEFSIDSHNLTLIASDGKPLEPTEVESIVVYVGERYDFIINTDRPMKNYWMRAKGLGDCKLHKSFQTAILNYLNGENVDKWPDYDYPKYDNMSRSGLQLEPFGVLLNASNRNLYKTLGSLRSADSDYINSYYKEILTNDTSKIKKHYFGMKFNRIYNPEFNMQYPPPLMNSTKVQNVMTPQINNISLKMPHFPLLYKWNQVSQDQICNSLNISKACPNRQYDGRFCTCHHTIELNLGDVGEFIFFDESQSSHPIHFHGLAFALLGSEKIKNKLMPEEVFEMDRNDSLKRNFNRPVIKDTMTVPIGGYSVLRFQANNPGTWLVHCHVEFHSEMGMAFLLKIGGEKDLPKEPSNWPQCGDYSVNDEDCLILSNGSQMNSNMLLISMIFYTFLVLFY